MNMLKNYRRQLLVIIVCLLTAASLVTVWLWDKKERLCFDREYKDIINNKK